MHSTTRISCHGYCWDISSERLERERKKRGKPGRVAEELERIVAELKRAPVLDARTAEEIIGYDEHGLPG